MTAGTFNEECRRALIGIIGIGNGLKLWLVFLIRQVIFTRIDRFLFCLSARRRQSPLRRAQEHSSGSTVHVYKPFPTDCRSYQSFRCLLYGKIQPGRPANRQTTINLQLILFQNNLYQILFRHITLQSNRPISLQAEIEHAFAAQKRR